MSRQWGPLYRDSYTSGQEAIQSIKENEAQRQRVRDLLQQLGSMQEIVPQTSSVVHRANSQDREVTYSEVQPWLQGARPLSKIKGDLRNLPYESLIELKNIFKADIKLWEQDRVFLDILGSSDEAHSRFFNTLRHLFPLFGSENILIDSEGNPKLVDVEGIDRRSTYTKGGLAGFIKSRLKLAGDYISLGLITLTMLGKHASTKGNISHLTHKLNES